MASGGERDFDVVVAGAGPAGIAAAVTAARSRAKVALLDDNPQLGGQIWRGGPAASTNSEAEYWRDLLLKSAVTMIRGARIFYADRDSLQAESGGAAFEVRYQKLILATGARELFLPFPGWTLPNVVGAGGLQALVKSGLPVAGKRVVVAGTGPLLLAVAAYLGKHDAKVVCICEQAPLSSLAAFGMAMLGFPAKIREAVRLRCQSLSAPYLTRTWPVAALGEDSLEAVRIFENQNVREVECDYLACGFHLVPNVELAQMLGCRLAEGFVEVDEFQQTTQPGTYSAGETTGIGGMELSLIEGQIAGYVAADQKVSARRFFASRARYRKLAAAMKKAFRARQELVHLAAPDTLLCRCEDVPVERVRRHGSWRAAKLHTRCGMGPCQGRICGSAASVLFGWTIDSVRPPVFPVHCSSLAAISAAAEAPQSIGGTK